MAKEMMCRVAIFLFSLFHAANALHCGVEDCYQWGSYCCGQLCCFSVWSYWWFWMIWILVLLFISCCSYAARRRYRAQPRYVVIQHPDGQRYGVTASLTASGRVNDYTVTPAPIYGAMPARQVPHGAAMATTQGPTKPPAYTDQKPPAYNAV